MKTKPAPPHPVFANARFRRLWLAQAVSVFGDYLAMFAVQALIVFRMRGSAAEVSTVLLVSLLPAIALGPFAGVFADRWDPRRTMVASDLSRAALVLLLMFVPVGVAHQGGLPQSTLVELCAICFAISCVSACFTPAQGVMLPAIVERKDLLAASAAMQQTWQWARIASPGVAASLVARFSERSCFLADAFSFAISALLIAAIGGPEICSEELGSEELGSEEIGSREICSKEICSKEIGSGATVNGVPRTPSRTSFRASSLWRDLRVGIASLFADAELSFAALAMAAGTFATGCYSSLAGVYVRDVLHGGMPVYGALGSLTAAGMLAGSFSVSKLGQHMERGGMIAGSMGVIGICILALAAFPSMPAALICSALIGLAASSALATANALMRERTPAELRGRVVSVSVALMSAAQAAALMLGGSGAARVGVRGVFVFAALMLLAQPAYRYFRRGTARSARAACFQNPR